MEICMLINYQRELEKKLEFWEHEGLHPSLLLHACCAPCSSWCLEYLNPYMDITVYFYNPNITSEEEYTFRRDELKRLISLMPFKREVHFMEGPYEPQTFMELASGLETAPERGPRCVKCYTQRLSRTAQTAHEQGFDYFATTLTLSPLKPANIINEIGQSLSPMDDESSSEHRDYPDSSQSSRLGRIEISAPVSKGMYLPTDFKKRNGYKRSIELSHEYNLYRQNYCGCTYSRRASTV